MQARQYHTIAVREEKRYKGMREITQEGAKVNGGMRSYAERRFGSATHQQHVRNFEELQSE